MEERAPGWLAAAWYWPQYRLFGRCWTQGCGRLVVLHGPRQLRRCESTPMAIGLTARGWLRVQGLDSDAIDAWCSANGIEPGAVVQPVVPVSHARSA